MDGILYEKGYLKIFEGNLKESGHKTGILETIKFYQNNDLKHKARLIQQWTLWTSKCFILFHNEQTWTLPKYVKWIRPTWRAETRNILRAKKYALS